MLERIKKALAECGCDAWQITETKRSGWEFYFIRRSLDQNRAVEEKTYSVEVFKYIDDKRFLGSASGVIAPTATDGEIAKNLSQLVYQASLVKNPAYTLVSKPVDVPEKKDAVDLKAISRDFIDAVLSVPETPGEDVNSFEIFAGSVSRRFVNSNGVRYACVYPSSTAEVVVNARNGSEEIELYRFFTSGSCDKKELADQIKKAMTYGRDRLRAVPTPDLKTGDVVFSTSDAVQIYEYFLDRTAAGFKVRQISDWEIGKPVCDYTTGDRITVRSLQSLKNSSKDYPVDPEGSVIRDRYLIKDGVVKNFWGSRQFSCYLGLEDSFSVANAEFTGGSATEDEIRSGDFLEVVEFSSFQVDSVSGDIAGEIRLGYLHRGGEVIPVTGGSVSGSMVRAASTMRFSKNTVQYDSRIVPSVTKLASLSIAGAAKAE